MKDAIKKKLQKALREPIKKECQVVYILVAIRKLLDRTNKRYPLLRFYCSWALHIEINRISPAREILEKLARAHQHRSKKADFLAVEEFIALKKFKEEIISFLKEFELPISSFKAENKWRNFRRLFIDILIDCPLKIKPEPIEEFSFISFRKIMAEENIINYKIKVAGARRPRYGKLIGF